MNSGYTASTSVPTKLKPLTPSESGATKSEYNIVTFVAVEADAANHSELKLTSVSDTDDVTYPPVAIVESPIIDNADDVTSLIEYPKRPAP